MSDSPKYVNFFVANNTGLELPTLWANHNTDDTPIQPYLQSNVASGATVRLGSLEIVPHTDDYFTVIWTDSSNNVYGTQYQYETETSMNGGDVTLQLQPGTFQFFQDNEGSLGDGAFYTQYIVAPAT